MMRRHRFQWFMLALAFGVLGCDSGKEDHTTPNTTSETKSAAPSNRVSIPDSVRRNLGITFVKVERRAVEKTIRVPGRFEYLPTARREHRTPLAGRVDLLAAQYQKVEPGTPLFRIDSAGWRELHERIAAVRARVDSMGPLRAAHRVHEQSLAAKVRLWTDRLAKLEELRAAGGGTASQYTEAMAALNGMQAELADVMEKDAQLHADQLGAEAELRALESRRRFLSGLIADTRGDEPSDGDINSSFVVHARSHGVVESFHVTDGGLAEESGLVLTLVRPDQVRFRARALQADLGVLREGLSASITPAGGTGTRGETIRGRLLLDLSADPDTRTLDLLVSPDSPAAWARAGIAALLEIHLEGGEMELAVPISALARDGLSLVLFRRDPRDPDKAIRVDADIGVSDGRWIVLKSGVKEGDEIVLGGNYQLMLATSGTASKGGHFHPDGTFHEGEDK